ncbi:3-beta hydroxysteroid dehydrogenase/isomerase [Corchorus olitorius]|uniref:Reticulon-like protein n=1 Tax=Corchorus olitorius TaxID=93759 RepID=A0A1R3KA24_9ROSI|nr:3-beta hydroxysteroid dehydrogenase/isomerase [Corchorus olitorius]
MHSPIPILAERGKTERKRKMVVTTTANDVAYGDWSETRTCVVLGGRGFLGRTLVARLLRLGGWIVRVADSSSHSLQLDSSSASDSLLSDALCSGQASFCHIDVRDTSQIVKVTKGADVVFYMEPSDLDTYDFCNCYMIVVQGAKNVINACRECKVRRLVYNSSADVAFDGSRDIVYGDESLSCPGKFQDLLTDLKFQAEGLIRLTNNIDGLLTCVLRPSILFGPGDKQFVPLLVNLAKSGLAKFIIGSGENMSDFTYAENVAHAHICAAEALDSRIVSVAGKAFFITNLEPVAFWEFVSLILEGLGYQRTFDCSAAEKHLGYSPVVSLHDGIKLTIESFSHLAKDSSFTRYSNFNEQSKAEKLLGSGKVADILLWRDEKRTFTCFLTLAVVFYWFLLGERTFTSSAAKLLLLVTLALYGYGVLPSKIGDFAVPRISPSCFQISESAVKDSIRTISYMWNRGFRIIRLLAKGEDWSKFFKAVVLLYLVKLIISYSLAVVVGIALIFAFTAFFGYEQYESEMDGLGKVLFCISMESKGLLLSFLPDSITSFLGNNKTVHQQNAPAVVKQWK